MVLNFESIYLYLCFNDTNFSGMTITFENYSLFVIFNTQLMDICLRKKLQYQYLKLTAENCDNLITNLSS